MDAVYDPTHEGMMMVVFGMLATYALVLLIWAVLNIVATWRVFSKAGEQGWKSIVPFLRDYVSYKMVWKKDMFFVQLGLSAVATVLNVVTAGMDPEGTMTMVLSVIALLCGLVVSIIWLVKSHKLSTCFGHGIGFTLGLIFLNPIFMMILGFGSSVYIGNGENSDQ